MREREREIERERNIEKEKGGIIDMGRGREINDCQNR